MQLLSARFSTKAGVVLALLCASALADGHRASVAAADGDGRLGSSAVTASSVVGGTVVINVVAFNKSAIPADATVMCEATISFSLPGPDDQRISKVRADVTPAAITCSIRMPYLAVTSPDFSPTVWVYTTIVNFGNVDTQLELQKSLVGLGSRAFPAPINGVTTTVTFTNVI